MSFISRIPENEGSVAAILKPYPEIAKPVSMMTEYVMRSEDVQFSQGERELIATFVSDLNACTYCARTHQATAEALGANESVFGALLDDIDTAAVEENLKPVILCRDVEACLGTNASSVDANLDTIELG